MVCIWMLLDAVLVDRIFDPRSLVWAARIEKALMLGGALTLVIAFLVFKAPEGHLLVTLAVTGGVLAFFGTAYLMRVMRSLLERATSLQDEMAGVEGAGDLHRVLGDHTSGGGGDLGGLGRQLRCFHTTRRSTFPAYAGAMDSSPLVWHYTDATGLLSIESYAIGLDPTAPLPVLADAGCAGEHLDLAPESAPWSSDPWAGRTRSVRHRPWTPVAYEDADQEELAARVLRNLPEAMETVRGWGGSPPPEGAEIPTPLLTLMEEFEQALVLIKHGGFRDEREVRRIVSVLNRPDLGEEWPGVVRHRASAYGITPYVALTGGTVPDQVITEEPHPLPIRAVAISPSPNGPAVAAALGSMLRSAGYDVPVHRSAIPFRG